MAPTGRQQRPVALHLGKGMSVCIRLGCKMEEEPRQIRDVVNLLRLLGLPSREDNNDGMDDDCEDNNGECNDAGNMMGNNKLRLAGMDNGGHQGGGRQVDRRDHDGHAGQ